jgi:hypothetical protein
LQCLTNRSCLGGIAQNLFVRHEKFLKIFIAIGFSCERVEAVQRWSLDTTTTTTTTTTMGTRIYPTTRNAAIIEILAEVPAGTHASLTKIRLDNNAEIERLQREGLDWVAIDEVKYEQWKKFQLLPEGRLDGFLTFGWGKFTSATYEEIRNNIPEGEGEDWLWNGGTTDVGLIDSIMEAQGVDLERLGINPEDMEGLCWG